MGSTNWTILSSNKVHINKNKDVILHTKCLISREAHISDAVAKLVWLVMHSKRDNQHSLQSG